MNDVASLQKALDPLLPGLLGQRLTEVTPERVCAELDVRPDLCTLGEICHGGALMAFADTLGAIGAHVNLPEGARTTTIESGTRFVGAAALGTRITGTCEALHRGRRTTVWQTRICSETGGLLAVVTQTQLVLTG